DLVRVLGRTNIDHLLILASDFDTLEFVFLNKHKREQRGQPAASASESFPRRSASTAAARAGSSREHCGDSPGPAGTRWSSSTSCAASSMLPPTPANTSRTGASSPIISFGSVRNERACLTSFRPEYGGVQDDHGSGGLLILVALRP